MFGTFLLRGLLFLSLAILTIPSSAQTSPTKTSPARTKQAPPRIERASWSEESETSIGISRADFAAMGLAKLTVYEYIKLQGWAIQREFKAEAKGIEEGKEAAKNTQPTYTCGPKAVDETALSKVSLLIQDNKDAASELMSGIRQRLRSIPDVEIVYDMKDADLVVSILGYEDKIESRGIGYTASIATSTPCTSKLGTTEWPFQMIENHFLQTAGKDVKILVEGIVTTLDSKDIENLRQQHASLKKFLKEQRK